MYNEVKKGKYYRELRWDKLDNTAHLFPVIAGEHMSNVYRISVTLSEKIVPELLQEALNLVLPKFKVSFNFIQIPFSSCPDLLTTFILQLLV